jgi:hypothetical protein
MLGRNARHLKRLSAFSNLHQFTERLVEPERIVAVGLLTRHDLNLLGPTFDRVWPVEKAPSFSELLRAIDEADQRLTAQKTSQRPS